MQMQTKRTTSRIPNLHNMSFTLTNHVMKLAHAYPAYLAVLFVERANELSDYFLKQQTKPPATTQATPR